MQIAAHSNAALFPAPRTLLGRGYVRQLERKGIRKLSTSHLKEVERLDRAYEAARAEVDARPGSLMSRVVGGGR